jgi:hypothetical protein
MLLHIRAPADLNNQSKEGERKKFDKQFTVSTHREEVEILAAYGRTISTDCPQR